MENTRAMFIQIPEETYRRMKAYLKHHDIMQKDFIIQLLEMAIADQGPADEIQPRISGGRFMDEYCEIERETTINFSFLPKLGASLSETEIENVCRDIANIIKNNSPINYLVLGDLHFRDEVDGVSLTVDLGTTLSEGEDEIDAEIFFDESISALEEPLAAIGCEITGIEFRENWTQRSWYDGLTISRDELSL